MTLSGVAVALLAADVAQGIGFSLEMGAFLAGFLLAGIRPDSWGGVW